MDKSLQEGVQEDAGGIISLAKAALQYREAIEHDLLVKTGHEMNDIGRSLSWDALDSFLRNADADSALIRRIDPDTAVWASPLKTNVILADIFDMLAMINANLMAIGSGKAAKKPKPYPRPGKARPDNEQHFGSGGLPPQELRKWIEEKRNAGNSTGDHIGDAGP